MSICAEFILNVWGFQDNKIHIYRTFNVHRSVQFLKTIEEPPLLYMVFPAGDSTYLLWDDNNFRQIQSDRSQEHEDRVTSIDVHYGKKLIVTGD